jgi:hypothetical protein
LAASRPADPPEPVGYKVAPEGIVVSGIFRGPDGPIVVINNQFLKVGQTFDQIKVTRIDDYAVELEQDGQRFLVSLSSSSSTPRTETPAETPAAEEPPPPPRASPRTHVPPGEEQPTPAATPPPAPPAKPAKTKGAWPPAPPKFN